MTAREKAAREFIKSARYGKDLDVCRAGLLAALRACETESRPIRCGALTIEGNDGAKKIRDRILDAMERANGGKL